MFTLHTPHQLLALRPWYQPLTKKQNKNKIFVCYWRDIPPTTTNCLTMNNQNKNKFLERLERGETVLCAEGYVFELERRGYLQAGPFVPLCVLEHPEVVRQLHRDFVHAGSGTITNSSERKRGNMAQVVTVMLSVCRCCWGANILWPQRETSPCRKRGPAGKAQPGSSQDCQGGCTRD